MPPLTREREELLAALPPPPPPRWANAGITTKAMSASAGVSLSLIAKVSLGGSNVNAASLKEGARFHV